nr:xylulokinase [Candidatus Neomarinimicrobiota bacterium]
MAYYIGLDVGTTTVKALLINSSGKILAEASREYPLSCPQPLWSEQNPEDWWQGSIACISELVKEAGQEKIIGIGLSGQMHGLVLLDAIGNILRPSILWNDQRTAVECTEITDTIGFERLMEITGNPVLPGFTAPKLAWVRKHEPAIYDNIARILLPKDYIRYRLTGEFATDVSDASGTAWLNVKKRNWSRKILDQLEISMDWMPRVYESSDITGYICPEAATFPGLEETTFVVGGGGDQAAGGVG